MTGCEYVLFTITLFNGPFLNFCFAANMMIFFNLFVDKAYGEKNLTPSMQFIPQGCAYLAPIMFSSSAVMIGNYIGRKYAIVFGYLGVGLTQLACGLLISIPKERWQ